MASIEIRVTAALTQRSDSSTVLQELCLLLTRRPHPLQHGQRGEGDSPAGRRHQDVRIQPGQGHFVKLSSFMPFS